MARRSMGEALSSLSDEEYKKMVSSLKALKILKSNNPLRISYKPSPKQEIFHRDSHKRRLLRAGNQVGKGDRPSGLLYTPSGVTTYGEINVGDFVIGSDGNPTEVTGVYNRGKMDVYRLHFDDRTWTECSEDHLWHIKTREGRFRKTSSRYGKWEVKTLKSLIRQYGMEPKATNRWSIPLCKPVEFDKRNLEVDPYTLGALLGDGCFSDNRVVLTTADEEMLNMKLPDGCRFVDYGGYSYGISKDKDLGKNPLTTKINKLGLMEKNSLTKFIPEDYLYSDSQDRLALLQGLLDTDGTVDKRGNVSFTSISKALADGVLFLVQSLGGKAKISSRFTSYTYKNIKKLGQKSYTVRIRLPELPVFRLVRKQSRCIVPVSTSSERVIRRIEKVDQDEIICIKVAAKDSLYLTRSFIVTHNTYAAAAEAWWHALGEHPYKDVPPAPNKGLVISADWAGYKDVIAKIMYELAPKHMLSDKSYFTDGIGWNRNTITLKNGSVIYFRSCESKVTAIAGLSVDWIWVDEPPKQELWGEITSRAAVSAAPIFMSFTPIGRPVDWLQEMVEGNLEENLKPTGDWHQTVIHVSPEDCPHRTKESILLQRESYLPSEYNQRVYGDWKGIEEGRLFSGFDDENVAETFEKNTWELALGLDHGEKAGKEVVLLLAYSKIRNEILVVDEYYSKTATTPEEDAEKILDMLLFHNITPSMIDMAYGDINTAGKAAGGVKINKILGNMIGVRIRQPDKTSGMVNYGCRSMNISMRRKHLKVHKRCKKLLDSIRYWKGGTTGKDAELKDAIDALRYITLPILEQMYGKKQLDRLVLARA